MNPDELETFPANEDSTRDATGQFDGLLDSVSSTLNDLHGVSHSRRFWGILTYRYLRKCVRVYNSNISIPAPIGYISSDTALGDMARDSLPPPEEAVAQRSDKLQARTHGLIGDLRSAAHDTLRLLRTSAWLGAGFSVSQLRWTTARSLVLGFHDFGSILPRVAGPVSYLRVPKGKWRARGDAAKRAALRAQADAAKSPLEQVAMHWLPAGYVEEFEPIYRGVWVGSGAGKQIHASFLSSIENRMAVAKYVASGATLNIYQHAACFGELRNFVLHHAESSLADRFMTWGWKLKANDHPYLALRLLKTHRQGGNADRQAEGPRSWLYVIGRPPRPDQLKVTLAIQRRLFSCMDSEKVSNIVVRPRGGRDGSWRQQVSDETQSRAKGIDDQSKGILSLADNVGLIILDHFPTTVFMECLTVGIPVVALVPPKTEFTSIARAFYDEFYRLGILHKTPESLAAFLNTVDLPSWSRSQREMAIFQDYRRTFCNCDDSLVSAP